MACRDLKSLTKSERKQFLDSFDEVLCDCDGVLWLLKTPIKGSAEAVQKLRSIGKKVRFVSNNTIFTYKQFYELLEKLGYGYEKDSLITPTMAIIEHLSQIKFDKEIFLLGSEGMKTELQNAGYKLAPRESNAKDVTIPVITSLQDNPNVGAVIVEIDLNLSYLYLALAATYLKRKDVLLIFALGDKVLPVSAEQRFIGPHFFQKLLEEFSGTEALRFAKPGQNMAKYVFDKYNITDPKKILFVGDTLEQDMKFASSSGFQKLFVFSGADTKEDIEKNNDPDFLPDFTLDTFGSIVEIINSIQ